MLQSPQLPRPQQRPRPRNAGSRPARPHLEPGRCAIPRRSRDADRLVAVALSLAPPMGSQQDAYEGAPPGAQRRAAAQSAATHAAWTRRSAPRLFGRRTAKRANVKVEAADEGLRHQEPGTAENGFRRDLSHKVFVLRGGLPLRAYERLKVQIHEIFWNDRIDLTRSSSLASRSI